MLLKQGIEAGTRRDRPRQAPRIWQPRQLARKIASGGEHLGRRPEIGALIADVMDKVGKDGVITVEESKGWSSRPNTSRVCSSTAATSAPTSSPTPSAWKRSIDDAYILITDKKISSAQDIVPALEKLVQIGKREPRHHRRRCGRRSAGDVGAQQAARHGQRPGHQGPGLWRPPQGHVAGHRHPHRWPGHHRGDWAASWTASSSRPGSRRDKVVSTKDDTTIVGGKGDEKAIKGRIDQIRARDRRQHQRL
jgi:chaperonin GroEL